MQSFLKRQSPTTIWKWLQSPLEKHLCELKSTRLRILPHTALSVSLTNVDPPRTLHLFYSDQATRLNFTELSKEVDQAKYEKAL